MNLFFRELALADLDDIWSYYADTRSENAAHRVVDELLRICNLLAEHPLLGRARPELSESVRSFPSGSYVVYYAPDEQAREATIVRVLHGARDIISLEFIE